HSRFVKQSYFGRSFVIGVREATALHDGNAVGIKVTSGNLDQANPFIATRAWSESADVNGYGTLIAVKRTEGGQAGGAHAGQTLDARQQIFPQTCQTFSGIGSIRRADAHGHNALRAKTSINGFQVVQRAYKQSGAD